MINVFILFFRAYILHFDFNTIYTQFYIDLKVYKIKCFIHRTFMFYKNVSLLSVLQGIYYIVLIYKSVGRWRLKINIYVHIRISFILQVDFCLNLNAYMSVLWVCYLLTSSLMSLDISMFSFFVILNICFHLIEILHD